MSDSDPRYVKGHLFERRCKLQILPMTAGRHPRIRSVIPPSLERDADQLLGFDGEFHRQFLDDFLDEAVDDQRDRFFLGNAAGRQ
jgi:hypothetical protein